MLPCRVTSAKFSGSVRRAHSNNTNQQMNENHVLRTTLSRVTKDLCRSVSFLHMFVFGSSAGASLTPLWMHESIVKMSMTSYNSSKFGGPKKKKFRRSLNSEHYLVDFFPTLHEGMRSIQRANGALILAAIKSTRLVANANRPEGIFAFTVSPYHITKYQPRTTRAMLTPSNLYVV